MFEFTTKAQKITDLPKDTRQFVMDADSVIEEVSTWKKSKTYSYKLSTGEKQDVKTYYTHLNGEYWMARHSEIDATKHPWGKVMEFAIGAKKDEEGDSWGIGNNLQHTEYEIEYTKVLTKWGEVSLDSYVGYSSLEDKAHLEKWASTWSHYELGAPLTTREFGVFILVVEPGYVKRDCAYVIQLVADRSSHSTHVRGVYCSIERFQLRGDVIAWTMCTTSDSGGNVPKWLQNSLIAKNVSHDVPVFLDWLAKK